MFGFKKRTKKRTYLDYASAPPVLPQALAAMRATETLAGNPGAIHREGVEAKKSLEDSRARIAATLGCRARELVFTSGLTEANNLAILGYARHLEGLRRGLSGTHWLVSAIEHDSVLRCFAEIERMGGTISYVEPDRRGVIAPEAVARALRPETVFISIGWANNEIGVVQPLAKIARVLRTIRHVRFMKSSMEESHGRAGIVFHTDAGQAPLYLPTAVKSLGVDLLSLGGNKLYGPHGIGALQVDSRVRLASLLLGGSQERGLRPGTESVALAAGFRAAFEVVVKERKAEAARTRALRDVLLRELLARVSGLVVNGDLHHSLPHMLNVSIPNIQSEYVTLALDASGIAVSTKSACREGEESHSHVVAALAAASKASAKEARAAWRSANTIRFSLGRDTTARDIGYVVRILEAIVLRKP